jgi:hypothetical protein
VTRGGADAGIVHQRVQLTGLGSDLLGGRGHGSIVSDIQLHKANVARFLQLSRSRSAAVRVARAQVDHETRLRQATDDGLPYSLVGSSDECDFLIG